MDSAERFTLFYRDLIRRLDHFLPYWDHLDYLALFATFCIAVQILSFCTVTSSVDSVLLCRGPIPCCAGANFV